MKKVCDAIEIRLKQWKMSELHHVQRTSIPFSCKSQHSLKHCCWHTWSLLPTARGVVTLLKPSQGQPILYFHIAYEASLPGDWMHQEVSNQTGPRRGRRWKRGQCWVAWASLVGPAYPPFQHWWPGNQSRGPERQRRAGWSSAEWPPTKTEWNWRTSWERWHRTVAATGTHPCWLQGKENRKVKIE